ncbi:hypothetical protein DSL72_007597 [Monilinia vaccinii-corymbosi]|uniref:Uncharacterized protein n=1 Tax=Monilinia vaccinii-corymbosi TaxID=61207 RepID=A0A8A3PHI6_9HELO|nr:hypothetical protein DSL72_007597 [Monilinia vaccinii-corymbosi]
MFKSLVPSSVFPPSISNSRDSSIVETNHSTPWDTATAVFTPGAVATRNRAITPANTQSTTSNIPSAPLHSTSPSTPPPGPLKANKARAKETPGSQ